MTRFSQQTAAELARSFSRNRAERVFGDEIPESKIDPRDCSHEQVSVQDWDAGICPFTGYRDAGTEVTCLDCGEEWAGEEYAALVAAPAAECVRCASTRKTVQSDRLVLGTPGAVCCGEVA